MRGSKPRALTTLATSHRELWALWGRGITLSITALNPARIHGLNGHISHAWRPQEDPGIRHRRMINFNEYSPRDAVIFTGMAGS